MIETEQFFILCLRSLYQGKVQRRRRDQQGDTSRYADYGGDDPGTVHRDIVDKGLYAHRRLSYQWTPADECKYPAVFLAVVQQAGDLHPELFRGSKHGDQKHESILCGNDDKGLFRIVVIICLTRASERQRRSDDLLCDARHHECC